MIHSFDQKSPEWFKIRAGRLTLSNLGPVLDCSIFETKEELGQRLRKREERIIADRRQVDRGIAKEDDIRREYQAKYPERRVEEIGFVVPVGVPWDGWKDEYNQYFGGSPDGLVDNDGIIEVKCSEKMPKPLLSYLNGRVGVKECTYSNYYAQIQGNMALLNRQWCDLLVHIYDDQTYEIRIPFDEQYWKNAIPKITSFIEKYLIN